MKIALTSLLFAALVSCSTYHRDFQKEMKKEVPAGSLEGPWKGEWKSEVNGHHGPIWCLVSKDPKKANEWIFRYRAGWGILQFGDYQHIVEATEKNKILPLDSSMKLPGDFGTYNVKGTLTPVKFSTRFKGNGDKGTMVLTRP
ncbi:hypothetical protein N9A94_03000 [Akkermansiaceae bacterium]|nr:hypothetical protein [Akkermansiaceae bacterium]